MISIILLISGVILIVAGVFQFSLLLLHARNAKHYRKEQLQSSLKLFRDQVDSAQKHVKKRSAGRAWSGYREFRVEKKTLENQAFVCSLALIPCDGKPLASFEPGQFLTFRFCVPGQDKPIVRCYSLSDCQTESTTHYRVTVKKLPAPHKDQNVPSGVASTYVYDQVKQGDTLEIKAPAGNFVLDQINETPVVLVSGGIGITPLLSMLNAIVASGAKRETWFYYGVCNSDEHIMREHLERIRREYSNIHIRVFYSSPYKSDREGLDYDCEGRISVDQIKREVPWRDAVFYVCGPSSMMTSLTGELLASNIPKSRIKSEAFGPASVPTNIRAKVEAPAIQGTIHVNFSRSGKRIPWDYNAGNLLEFAHENNIEIDSGCRAGSCGTCAVAVKAGDVVYLQEPEVECDPGTCLACITAPGTELTLEV